VCIFSECPPDNNDAAAAANGTSLLADFAPSLDENSDKIQHESDDVLKAKNSHEISVENIESTTMAATSVEINVSAAVLPQSDAKKDSEDEVVNEKPDSVSDKSQTEGYSRSGGEKVAVKEEEESNTKFWYLRDIRKQWRKFNIDLMPKLLYCRGSLVELLISSDVAKYCEFRSVTRVLTYIGGKLEQVPCSRADVFASHSVGVIEKRMLMKLLTFCLEYNKNPSEYAGYESRPFVEFLKSKNLTDTVRHYVQHAIAMVTDQATTIEGLQSTQKFLQSLGRYGNTAFLWPLYGSGELPQCFCRLCAVFGGIYCLRRQATAAILDADNKLTAVIESTGQRLSTKWLVMEASYASSEILTKNTLPRISRAVLITDHSIKVDKQKHISLLSVPLPGCSDICVTIYELSSDSLACPDGLYVVHMTCTSVAADAKTDLQPVVELLFQPQPSDVTASMDSEIRRPNVLWSLFFNVDNSSRCDLTSSIDNILVVSGPDEYIDYDHAVTEARQIFERMCPGEEFLPKAPNPEDIIYDDGETGEQKESGFESGDVTAGDSGLQTETATVSEGNGDVVSLTTNAVEQLTTDDTTTQQLTTAAAAAVADTMETVAMEATDTTSN
jgi:RAB protein geranylgeranyltransferase component A